MVRMVVLVSCVTFFGIGAIPVEAQDEWPQWRGPSGQGHATAQHLPETWSNEQNMVWSRNLPGRGWSSPVVTGNLIWVTAAVETPATPEEIARGREDSRLVSQVRSVCTLYVSTSRRESFCMILNCSAKKVPNRFIL